MKVNLIFIRHGETKGNLGKRYIGKTDESLCEEGRQRILKLADGGKYPLTDFVFLSPMKRCRETCQIIYPSCKMCVIEEFREIDFGLFENRSYKELEDDINYINWIKSNGELPFPDGEPRESFIDRCYTGFLKACDEINRSFRKKIPVVAFVIHGGTIMAIMSKICGKSYFDWQVKNGCGYVVEAVLKDGTIEVDKVEKL